MPFQSAFEKSQRKKNQMKFVFGSPILFSGPVTVTALHIIITYSIAIDLSHFGIKILNNKWQTFLFMMLNTPISPLYD